MTNDLMIMSFPRDYEWLRYNLRSIEKHVTGYRHIHVVIPRGAPHPTDIPSLPITFHDEQQGVKIGYVRHQVTKLSAHEYTDADLITFIDSDHFCFEPW